MAAWLPWLLCLWLLAGDSEAVTFHECPLAQIFLKEGLDGYAGIFLEEWVCIAKLSSNFNTEHKNSYGFGLFHLNTHVWCQMGDEMSLNLCNICCSKLADADLHDDIRCIKKIVNSPQKLNQFWAWKAICKDQPFNQWLNDCKDLDRPWKNIS